MAELSYRLQSREIDDSGVRCVGLFDYTSRRLSLKHR